MDPTMEVELTEVQNAPELAPESIHQQIDELAKPAISALDGFNPAIHAVDENGMPKKKPNGEYALKRGRKPGQTARAPIPKNDVAITLPNPAKAAAIESASILIFGGVAIFGDEWNPKSPAEQKGLEDAFERYYVAKGVTEFPPTVALLLAVAAYSVPRLAAPATKSKVKQIAEWGKEKLGQGAKFIAGK
jgi:hypothetical protein